MLVREPPSDSGVRVILTDTFSVDIKELKLLGGFDHPNIVRFVRQFLLPVLIQID